MRTYLFIFIQTALWFVLSEAKLVKKVKIIGESVLGCRKADLSCPKSDITFWLYSTSNIDGIQLDIANLTNVPWVAGPLKFLVHGYTDNKEQSINANLRPAYLQSGQNNIISADYSTLAKLGCYAQAVNNIPTVAKCVAEFFKAVLQAHHFSDVHLLGHSLGAHVAAWASTMIPGLPRLTKFDPAKPMITEDIDKKGQAQFIDVYHSNAEVRGQSQPSGDVDVWFNNGVYQPGCDCDRGEVDCSHQRCVVFFAESVFQPMKAFACSSWRDFNAGKCRNVEQNDLVYVGENANKSLRENYIVLTNAQPPYILQDSLYSDTHKLNSLIEENERVCLKTKLQKIAYGALDF